VTSSRLPLLGAVLLILAVPLTLSGQAPQGQPIIPDPDHFEATARTDDAELEAQVRRLARELRCPTCQALSIYDSPSELAREMKGQIRARLQSGMTPAEVRASFVESYGEWVLLSPDPRGFNLVVYILPILVLLLGAVIVLVGMKRWLVQPAGDGPSRGKTGVDGSRGDPEQASMTERVPPAS
jgi:cytochrome c-type biogenesis protein CcmH/NrfF